MSVYLSVILPLPSLGPSLSFAVTPIGLLSLLILPPLPWS